MEWAYGITTVPSRIENLFPRTLASLSKAGFDQPRLFVDGCKSHPYYDSLGLEITYRYPNLRTHGNWVLSIYELYIRNPHADFYAIFQDDFVTCLNLRRYLERCEYPNKGYWNLYMFPNNQSLCPEGKTYQGWYPSDQWGKGAVALVFNRETLCTLLTQRHLVDRPQDEVKGHKAIDGGISDSFNKIGWLEYVHSPCLIQHTGIQSSMGNVKHPLASSFQGEDFDLLTLDSNKAINDQKLSEWEAERVRLEQAIIDDEARLTSARTTYEKGQLNVIIEKYRQRLRKHLRSRRG